jgi:hypothetical protein
MIRLLLAVFIILIASCATANVESDAAGISTQACSKTRLRSLNEDVARANDAFDKAADIADKIPTEENNAKAAEAVAVVAAAKANLEVTCNL